MCERVIDLSTLSLVGGSGIAEAKVTLWSADGTSASGAVSSAGSFIQDGSTALTSSVASPVKIFTLSANWSSILNFAFEGSIYSSSASFNTNSALWDMTTSSIVSASQISTTNTTDTVLRSGKFTLIPSHIYGVTLWNPTATAYISDASLIIFP